MTARTLRLDEIVDPLEARVLVTVDAAGAVVDARFDLAGLPRVDALMVGRPVAGVPALVERLCGLCPAAHHLAGVRALDALLGFGPPPPTADAVRRLLHHGAALDAHAPRFAAVDRPAALVLR
nr:reducing hydrogenase subunit alpha [Propionibacterium sp.]